MGCYRSLEEIKDWQSASAAQRNAVLERCAARRDVRETALQRYLRGDA